MDYKKIIKNQETRLKIISFLFWIPTKIYLKIVYRIKTGKKLNLKKPVGFNEKLNWLKVNNKDYKLAQYVDKLKAREIVESKCGNKAIIPIYGSWDSFDEIDFAKLPDSFVLKCNHDSGSVRIIENKNNLTSNEIKQMRKFFNGRLKRNLYYIGREYPYKTVKPKIFAEMNISNSKNGVEDYKFFCFNGTPVIMYIAKDRLSSTTFDFYDMNFKLLDIKNIHPNSLNPLLIKPPYFDEMVSMAKTLSESFPFVRIDLYQVNGNIYFGEYTFFHGGGFWLFEPEEWEIKLGKLIETK